MCLRIGNQKRKWASEMVTGKELGSQIYNQKKKLCFVSHSTRKLSSPIRCMQGSTTIRFLLERVTKQKIFFRLQILDPNSFPFTTLEAHFLFRLPFLKPIFYSGYHFWGPFSFTVTNSQTHTIPRIFGKSLFSSSLFS